MALLDNISEIKKYNGAIAGNVELFNLQSFIDDAIYYFLLPAIGQTQFDALVAAKPTAAESSNTHKVIQLLQKAAVGYMLANYADNGALQIGNTGISVAKTEKSAPASDKKILALKRYNQKSAYQALEQAVNFLETYIDEFTAYKASDEHLANRGLLINTSREFQESGINIGYSAQLFFSLKTYIANATDNIIAPLLPADYLEALQGKIQTNNLSDFEKKLLKKIRKPLAASALAEAIPYRAVSIDANGIFELSDSVGGISGNVENRQSASDKKLSAVMTGLSIRADQELETLRQFINNNATEIGITPPTPTNLNDGSAERVYAF